MFSDDHWDIADAQVACRTLGFSTEGAVATWNSEFGAVSDSFIMDDVNCTGTESHIGLCMHNYIENCGASEVSIANAGQCLESPPHALVMNS